MNSNPENPDAARGAELDEPRFENGRALRIAGLSATFSPAACDGIPALWERFGRHIGQVPGQAGNAAYGVCYDSRADGQFSYLCGVEVNGDADLPAGFSAVHIPAQRYAVFTHHGHISLIRDTIGAIWGRWIPASGLEALPAPCFERYDENFDPATGLGGVEIWVPLKG